MKNSIFYAVMALLVAGALAFVPAGGYKVGDVAADFNLKNIDGKMVSLAQIPNAKGYVVIFTCNTCPYAQAYEDRIIELHKKLAPQGYPVVAINPNDPSIQPADNFDAMKKQAMKKGYPFYYLSDAKQDVTVKFGAERTPQVFVLDEARKVRYIGAIDNNAMDADAVSTRYVEAAVEAIQAGQDPDPAFTRAIGCGIKLKKK